MELTDEIRISAPREVVYAALNDVEILKNCISGCQEIIKHSDQDLEAKVQLKVGPVKATFGGKVTLDTSNAPAGYSLTGEGSGGPAGFAKGGADVELLEEGDETILRYTAKADVGGKIAQLGSRLIDSTAKRLSGQFFTKFSEEVIARQTEATDPDAAVEAEIDTATVAQPATQPSTPDVPPETPSSKGVSPMVWIGIGVAALAIVIFLATN